MTAPVVVPSVPKLPAAQKVWALANILLNCLCTRLTDTVGGKPCLCYVMPGDEAIIDSCTKTADTDGTAWVRLVQMYESVEFPNPIDRSAKCVSGFWVAQLELGVSRCASKPTTAGSTLRSPSQDALNADAAKVFDDAAALQYVVECCVPKGLPFIPSIWQPASAGGCTGGTISVFVQLVPGAIAIPELREG